MKDDLRKYKLQNNLFSMLILVLIIILIVELIVKFSFAQLPLGFILLSFVIILIIYLLYNNTKSLLNYSNLNVKSSPVNEHQKEEFKTNKTEHKNAEQWHKSLLKGITKKTTRKGITEKFLKNIINDQQAEMGLFYLFNKKTKTFEVAATYAYLADEKPNAFKEGEGLNGQVVKNKAPMHLQDLPENYLNIVSGLGKGKPKNLLLFPVIVNDTVQGLVELASFKDFDNNIDQELTIFFEANSDKFLNIEDN